MLANWMEQSFLGITGYADDNFLLSPTLDGLQEMLETCEQYADEHNLKFSTDPDPKKCKTKCLAFLNKERPILRKMKLCGNDLNWAPNGKHLGNKIENNIKGMNKDLLEKRARFIDRNSELNQEFYFAHPRTKFKMNNIFNTHFSGSPLWDLFGPEAEKFEKSWNISVRTMFDLPRETHCYFIESISEHVHLKSILVKRFLKFVEQLKKSEKIALKEVLKIVKNDCQSTTGSNLRRIMLLLEKDSLNEVSSRDADELVYASVPEEENWRINFVQELTDIKFGDYEVKGFSPDEINEILRSVCIC